MQKLCLFVGILFISLSLYSQNQWYTDQEMNFTIQVPAQYSQNQMQDGSDRVLTIMSPDQNVFVRVRAMAANDRFTADLLQQAFEQNMIQGAKRIVNEDGDLHGIPARASAYTWSIDGSEAVLAVYYIIQNSFAYVVWAAIPQAQSQQYSATADGILESFDLLTSGTGNQAFAGMGATSGSAQKLQVQNVLLGSQVDANYRVLQANNQFLSQTLQINVSFLYSGETNSQPFVLKWFCHTHERKIQEYTLQAPNQENGHGYGFISNQGHAWPSGEYSVEIWHRGSQLEKRNFQIR